MSDIDPPESPIRGPESWFTSDDESVGDLTLPHWTEPGTGQVDAAELAGWVLQDQLNVRVQLQLHKILWGDVPGK